MQSLTLEENEAYRYFEGTTDKTRLGYVDKRRRIPILPMMKKVLLYIDLDNADNTAKKTISELFKSVFPEKHVHELRYAFISRCKKTRGNLELVM